MGRVRRAVLISLSLCALIACGSGNPQSATRPVDTVILISIDSLRADRLGAYGHEQPTSPHIDALARDGLRFDRAYSTTSWTLPSHAALLTGLDDYSHGTISGERPLPSAIDTLAEQLGRAGVRTTGFFAGPYLHPSFGVSQGFDDYLDCTSYGNASAKRPDEAQHDASHGDVTNPILLERVAAWLATEAADRLGKTAETRFIFVHMWDVHYDYIAPQRFVDLFDPDYSGTLNGVDFAENERVRKGLPARDLKHLLALYDAEIRYTDETLGALLDLFEQHGMLERSAVIVTADHGEEFLEHGGKGHGLSLDEEVLHIPLLLKLYGRPPARSSSSHVVSLIDVAPTVCELLGVACQYGSASRSLLSDYLEAEPAPPRDDALAELNIAFLGQDMTAMVSRHGRIVRWNKTGKTLFYRAAKDGESAPAAIRIVEKRIDSYPYEVRAIHRLLTERRDAAEQERQIGGDEEVVPVDPDTRRHLKALGYVD